MILSQVIATYSFTRCAAMRRLFDYESRPSCADYDRSFGLSL